MLKLNASYSKKVPADTEYSSQSYHGSVEVELPDGLTPEQFYAAILAIFSRSFDMTAEATPGGTISPAGTTRARYSTSLTYVITPDPGYEIRDTISQLEKLLKAYKDGSLVEKGV